MGLFGISLGFAKSSISLSFFSSGAFESIFVREPGDSRPLSGDVLPSSFAFSGFGGLIGDLSFSAAGFILESFASFYLMVCTIAFAPLSVLKSFAAFLAASAASFCSIILFAFYLQYHLQV